MTSTITPFRPRPRNFTSAEAMLERVREEIFRDGRAFAIIAAETRVASSTIANIASGKTRWPRHSTLFPLIAALGLELSLRSKGAGK